MEVRPLRPAGGECVYSITLTSPPHPALAQPTIRLLLQTVTFEGETIDEQMVTVPTSKIREEAVDDYGCVHYSYADEEGREYQVELRKWDEEGFEGAELPDTVHQAVHLQRANDQ